MLSAIYKNQKVYAFETEKEENKIFFCECCNSEVILKKGLSKLHHFAHKSNTECIYKTNESEEHLHIKEEIYKSLLNFNFIKNLEMEKFLGNAISDIYFEKNNQKIAVEIQLSNLTKEKIIERTLRYKEKDIHVIWIHSYKQFLNRINLEDKTICLKDWEKWLVSMNYGKLFLWKKEEKLIPVSFEKIYNNHDKLTRNRYIKSEEIRSIALHFFGIKKEAWNILPEALILSYKKN